MILKSECLDQINLLKKKIIEASECINLPDLDIRIQKLTEKTLAKNFWDTPDDASEIAQELSALEKKQNLWKNLIRDINGLQELVEIVEENSEEISEILNEINILEKTFARAEQDLLLSGEFDSRNAIIEITAGVGGTEAQDYAEMLLRMYLRFAERKEWKTEILEKSLGTEAGIKSCVIEVKGYNAFGLLMAEKGTHRLVRQSPFNAKSLRQTSFAGVMVTPELKGADVSNINIPESEIRVDTFKSSGSGGQHANKTDSAVRMIHLPSKITVVCESQRSQHQNKEKAMEILKSRLALKTREEEEAKAREVRGEHTEAAWGTQIRNYVLHPYKLVKDLRTTHETTNPENVFDGDLEEFHQKYLEWKAKKA